MTKDEELAWLRKRENARRRYHTAYMKRWRAKRKAPK